MVFSFAHFNNLFATLNIGKERLLEDSSPSKHTPSIAIQDIFKNGKLYGTECATAMIIIFYKALLSLYEEETFNRLFANLLLYTWDYDQDLKLITKTGGDLVPGDLVYFKNPQVNPATIEWQGENTIYLGNFFFYGHGVGVKTKEEIIYALNERRVPYAFISAFLTDTITRIDSRLMSLPRFS